MRRRLFGLLVACALVVAACGDDGDDAASDDTRAGEDTTTTEAMEDDTTGDDAADDSDGGGSDEAATISGLTFQPDPIEVQAGATVVWSNEDGVGHTVSAEDGSFDEAVDAGGTASVTFDEAGEYEYFCGIHPQMNGTVVVS